MKKQSLIIAIMILSIGFVTAVTFAKDKLEDNEQNQKNLPLTTSLSKDPQPLRERDQKQIKEDRNNENEQEIENEDIDNNGLHDEENGLAEELDKIPDLKESLSISLSEAKTASTYADLVNILNSYLKALDNMSSPANVATSTLSQQEQQLFSSLKTKHSFELGRADTRTQELKSQINDLVNLLNPLGNQAINEGGELKKILIETIKDIRNAILDTAELHDKSNDILSEETK